MEYNRKNNIPSKAVIYPVEGYKVKHDKKHSVVVFEVNDEGRQHEFSGEGYIPQFIDFVKSLGFDADPAHKHIPDQLMIEGFQFYIDSTHASFMGRNGWSRKEAVRKSHSRYISICKWNHPYKETVIKVPFNKELDQEKLKGQIQAAVQEKIDWDKEIETRKNQDRDFTIAVAKNFLVFQPIKNFVDYIRIHEGVIEFQINKIGCLSISPDGRFKEFNLYKMETKTEADLKNLIDSVENIGGIIRAILDSIGVATTENPLSEEIQKWAQTAYSRYFNIKEMKYWKD